MKSQSPFQSVEMWHWSAKIVKIIIELLQNKKGITIVHIITLRQSVQEKNQAEHEECYLFPKGQYQYER